jgi:hypothetical protein
VPGKLLALANEVIELFLTAKRVLLHLLTAANGTHRRFNDDRSYVGSWG